MNELVAAVVGAVVGVLGAQVIAFRGLQRERASALLDAQQERRMQRGALASGLLIELQALEHILRRFRRRLTPATWQGKAPVTLFPALLPQIGAVTPAAADKLLLFYGLVRDVYFCLDRAHELGADSEEWTHLNYLIRLKATFALQAMQDAASALRAEGGQMPEPKHVAIVRYPDLPALPDKYFPTTYSDAEEEAY